MTQITLTVRPRLGCVMWIPLVAKKGRHREVGANDHRTSGASVPAGGLSLRLSTDPLECRNACAPVSPFEAYPDAVNEHLK